MGREGRRGRWGEKGGEKKEGTTGEAEDKLMAKEETSWIESPVEGTAPTMVYTFCYWILMGDYW